MSLPFRRIAITPPGLLLGSQEGIQRWVARAQGLGADALLLREKNDPDHTTALKTAAELLENGTQALLLLLTVQENINTPLTLGLHFISDSTFIPNILTDKNLRGKVYGKSCHSLEEVQAASKAGFHYVFLSPIFPTQTHPGEAPLGLDKLAEICAAFPIPVFALGGITDDNERLCLQAGAWGTAAIGRFLSDTGS